MKNVSVNGDKNLKIRKILVILQTFKWSMDLHYKIQCWYILSYFKYIYSYFLLEYRIMINSQKIYAKRESFRKSPNAYFKPQLSFSAFKTTSLHTKAINISQYMCDYIIQSTQLLIENVEEIQLFRSLNPKAEQISQSLLRALGPSVYLQYQHNSPQDQPKRAMVDLLCANEKPSEVKRGLKCRSINTPSTLPQKDLSQRVKYCRSSKQLLRQQKKKGLQTLVPLSQAQSQMDLKFTQIQNFYRQRFARQDQINQEDNSSQMKILRRINSKDKQQFAFGYDGQKIPINYSTNVNGNPVKVLKTLLKVHKDKHQIKDIKKTHQSFRVSKFPEVGQTSKSIYEGFDLRELKQKILKNVKWAGKLNSLKLISQREKPKS